ncbi:putative Plasmid maintenance system killer protein [Candidatus Defluviicoccus seviourii]|uniref:Plasmid maintenance system killer protein n=2 Tax=root TaxID=1 RepID=A0A564WGD9_9PROT|nr:putative Plasmid maintenance system killer protein [uncultured Defluviicoccus sp.]SUS08777.1 putative Plasmid maintenance system killer protein [uncultured Defluviicoccus sp.]VUX47535.1 putative Plasmid maintenance system killer protein [Candidatus Defluviicoccus seviourii]
MIRSFRDRRTAAFAAGERVKEFHAFAKQAQRRLVILNAAERIEDLMMLPSNRFEALRGTRQGQFSIRINEQWRICFTFREGDAFDVEITDYH